MRYVQRALRLGVTRRPVSRLGPAAQATELSIEFDGASAELLPNDVLEDALHRHVQHLGGVPFDATDQERARKFLATCTPSEIDADRVRSGLAADDPRVLHDSVQPLDRALPRHQVTGSTDVGDVSWVTPTVQLMSACLPFGTPGHSWQFVAQGKLPAAHKGMVDAAKAIGAVAAELLTDAAVLERAQDEFRRVTARTPYRCPIPDGVLAPTLRAARS
ncbi:hypothetical protein ACWD00_23355 [Streptomyces viridiviolaceus]